MRQQKALTIITRLKPDADNIKDLGEFLHQIGHHKKNPYVRNAITRATLRNI